MTGQSLFLILAFAATLCAPKADEPPATGEQLEKAKAFLEIHQKLEREFDPKAADLYDDAAVIRIRRTYPNGEKRDVEIDG